MWQRTFLILLGLSAICLKKVDFSETAVPTIVDQIFWCGTEGRTVIALTQEHHVYKSEDEGNTWRALHPRLIQHGKRTEARDEEVGVVNFIKVSPLDSNIVIFFGNEGVVWVSQDCGSTITALYQGEPIQKYEFHPTEPQWGLASTISKCAKEEWAEKNCIIKRDLYYTQDLGNTWKKLAEYVDEFNWGVLDSTHISIGIPKERVLVVAQTRHSGHQEMGNGWSSNLSLFQSDDFFQSKPKVLVKHGNRFSLSADFLYVAQVANERVQETHLLVAHRRSKFQDFEKARLPYQHLKGHSFSILDTSEGASIIHVDHFGNSEKYGHLYVSDSTGVSFSLSLEFNVRESNGVCDMQRIWGLEGIYFANAVDVSEDELMMDEFDEQDMNFSQENPIMSSHSGSSKQAQELAMMEQKLHEANYEEFQRKSLEHKSKTYVTFNKGGRWQLVTPPTVDSKGRALKCQSELGCSLHFHSSSTQGSIAPLYSFESAPGLIISNGNVGPYLVKDNAAINTYLSRDAGKTWFQIAQGSHVFEFGNYGALIVMAPDLKPTSHILYSWDQGLTWDYEIIINEDIIVENIMIEPSASSQKFIIIGFKQNEALEGVLIHLDFTPMHERVCNGLFDISSPHSDFQKWSPYDGRHGHKCLMGRQLTYTRRKREAKCSIQGEMPRPSIMNCECTEQDYECDEGYARQNKNSPCIRQDRITKLQTEFMKNKPSEQDYNPELIQQQQCQKHGYYFKTQGYRKIAGNSCFGGLNRNPQKISCSFVYLSSHKYIFIIVGIFIVLGLCYYYGAPAELLQSLKARIQKYFQRAKHMAASNNNRKEEQYEQVGVGAVPDFYEPDDDEDDSKLAPLEKSKTKDKSEEKEEDFSQDKPLEL